MENLKFFIINNFNILRFKTFHNDLTITYDSNVSQVFLKFLLTV